MVIYLNDDADLRSFLDELEPLMAKHGGGTFKGELNLKIAPKTQDSNTAKDAEGVPVDAKKPKLISLRHVSVDATSLTYARFKLLYEVMKFPGIEADEIIPLAEQLEAFTYRDMQLEFIAADQN